MEAAFFAVMVLIGLGGVVVCLASLIFVIRPWLKALLSGAHLSLFLIVAMRLRSVPVDLLIDTYVTLIKAGEQVPMATVEAVYLANRMYVTDLGSLVELVRDTVQDLELSRDGA